MDGRFVLISGSASHTCSDDRLKVAIRFVESFTEEALKRGGGFVVLAGAEESAKNGQGTPLIFDWVVLRAVERFAENTFEKPRTYAQVVMSDQAPNTKIAAADLKLLGKLEQRNVVERVHIRREVYTGGEYRTVMADLADAMVAVGGGKGTYSAATEMIKLDKPVLPLDLEIGAITEDGEGAVALHKELMADPDCFFPNTHSEVKNRLGLLSLNRGLVGPEAAALTAAEMLSKELRDSQPRTSQSPHAKSLLRRAWRIVKELPIVVAVIKVAEFIRHLLS